MAILKNTDFNGRLKWGGYSLAMDERFVERQVDELAYLLRQERRERLKLEQALLATQAELAQERQARRYLQRELLVWEGRAERLLSPKRPFDYLRLLWWVLVRPDVLKAYRADLDYQETEMLLRQGSWLVSSMLWLPVLGLLVFPWLSGALPLSLFGGLLLVGGIVVAWLVTGVLGIHDNALAALAAVFATAVVALCVTALVTFFVSHNIQPLMVIGGAALLIIMTAVMVTRIIELSVAGVVSHVVAVVIGGGVLIFLVDHSERLLDVVALTMVAVIIVPLLEERYKNAA